jgi:hypothetical protein
MLRGMRMRFCAKPKPRLDRLERRLGLVPVEVEAKRRSLNPIALALLNEA